MKNIHHLLLSIALVVMLLPIIHAQGRIIDSLKLVLQTQQEDTNKIKTLIYLSGQLSYSLDQFNSLEYAKKAVSLSSKINKKQLGNVNISEATYERLKANPEFRFSPRGKIEAKGKGEMEMYFISKNENS